MRTSYSALETYRLCPQKFKFQEIDRIPAKKSKSALFGTHIHAALRYLFSKDPLFPTIDQVLDFFRSRFPSAELFDASLEERALYLEDGEKILKNFYARNAPWNFTVLDLESHFEVILEDPKKRETHVLAGRIDRIDKTADGYEVIDYKTSRRLPSQAAVDQDLQMSVYALGLQKRWPHVKPEEITLSLYFLKHGEKLSTRRTADAAQATTNAALNTISEVQKKIASNDGFEAVPGAHCGFCPYKPLCPAWKHLYRKKEAGIDTKEEIASALEEYFRIIKDQKASDSRLAELKSKLRSYMEANGYERLFGENGYIAKSIQRRFTYDFDKIRSALEPLGRWEEILAADEKRLASILKSLPPETRSEIENAKILAREFTVLTASAKKIEKPSETQS